MNDQPCPSPDPDVPAPDILANDDARASLAGNAAPATPPLPHAAGIGSDRRVAPRRADPRHGAARPSIGPRIHFVDTEETAHWDLPDLGLVESGSSLSLGAVHASRWPRSQIASVALVAVPQPERDRTTIHLQSGPEDEPSVGDVIEIADATGARIWTRRLAAPDFPETRLVWDGRDETGERVPDGVYWIRLARGELTLAAAKLNRSP